MKHTTAGLAFFPLFILALFSAHFASGQIKRKPSRFWNVPLFEEYNDNSLLYVGFTVPSVSNHSFYFEKSDHRDTHSVGNPAFGSIQSRSGIEMGAGIPTRLRINHYISIATGVKFRNILYKNTVSESPEDPKGPLLHYQDASGRSSYKMQRNMFSGPRPAGETNFMRLEVPLHLHLRSDYKHFSTKNDRISSLSVYRLYLLGGASYGWNLNSRDHYDETGNLPNLGSSLIVKPTYINVDMGLGMDLFFTYFKLSPEIRFSRSVGNMLDMERHERIKSERADYHNPHMDALKRLGLQGWQISLIFE